MRRLTVQLLLPILLVVLAFVLVAALYWSRAFESVYIESLTERLEREARLIADAMPEADAGADLDAICRLRAGEIGGRVTVISAEGRVLGESEEPAAFLENHAQRPEIIAAGATGLGTATRFSHTLGYDMLYVAVQDRRGTERRFIRVAMPLRALGETQRRVRTILGSGLLLAVALGGGAAVLFSRRTAARIRNVEAMSREILSGRDDGCAFEEAGAQDELGSIEHHLVDLAREMRVRLAAAEDGREKLEAVLRSMADGVIVLDREGKIVLCNRFVLEQLEIPPSAEVTGKRLSLLCRHPDLLGLTDDVLAGRRPSLSREIVVSGPEPSRVLSVSAAPFAAEGNPEGAILVFHDVTRLRQLEAVRADFVANVSHELRTPLTAIRGYAETLLDGVIEDHDQAVRFLRIIQRHGQRLTRLIDDLLTLSDLELGKTEIRPRPVAIDELVEAVLEVLRPTAAAKPIDLVAEIPPDFPTLLADRDRVEQVLINLVDNAIKYSKAGTRVCVRARTLEPENGAEWVEITVEDQGIGIPEKDLPRLTERFYRVDRARSRELGGTGLGLAIVKHIVQAHGGWMAIESRVNVGTTVRVVLPVTARLSPTAAEDD